MSRDLQSFEVLVHDEDDRGEVSPSATRAGSDSDWWLEDLTPSAHAVGCLAAEGSRPALRLLTLPGE
jgi:hypothetical protein